MRLPLFIFVTSSAFGAAIGIPLPDQPGIADLAQFRLECQSTASTTALLEQSGKSAEAAQLQARLWERYDEEVFSRRAQAADLSLAVVNPWLSAAERAAATEQLTRATTGLSDLATFTFPDPATRDQLLAKLGREVTETDRSRAKAYLLLQKIRQGIMVNQLADRSLTERRQELVARLERLAAGGESLDAAVKEARALPATSEAVRSIGSTFGNLDAVESFRQLTGESFALDATLTSLIAADPANTIFWLARARVRFALGWRPAAIVDLAIASNFSPEDAGVLALRDQIRAVPSQVASLWQESVVPENGSPAALERAERAALRNRGRHIYASSFIGKPPVRLAALRYTDEQNPLLKSSATVLTPPLIQRFQEDKAAAGKDMLAVLAVHHRYAPYFAVTDGFWQLQVAHCIASDQTSGAGAALAVADSLFPSAAWLPQARGLLNPVKPLPEAAK